MGVPNGDMALFTSLLYLPWTIKPFWSPFVDIIKTQKMVGCFHADSDVDSLYLAGPDHSTHPDEATMAAGTTPISMFTITLILFIITAFASATHDIAADGSICWQSITKAPPLPLHLRQQLLQRPLPGHPHGRGCSQKMGRQHARGRRGALRAWSWPPPRPISPPGPDLLRPPSTRSTTLSWAHSRVPQPALRDRDTRRAGPRGRGRGQLPPSASVPTRIIEHKHFEFGTQDKTVITREYPADWKPGDEPYYPINDAKNEALYRQYEELAAQEGRRGTSPVARAAKYYDMDKAIAAAFELVRNELGVEPTEA